MIKRVVASGVGAISIDYNVTEHSVSDMYDIVHRYSGHI